MRIHLDTNLLISTPRWELLPPGDHEYLVSAIVFAEFGEGTAHPDPDIAAQARIDLIQHRSTYGDGLPSLSGKPTSTANYAPSPPPADGLQEACVAPT